MDLKDAVSYHLMTLGAEGRSPQTQRNYLHYERLLLTSFEELGIPLSMDAITLASVRQALDWYRAHVNTGTSRGGVVAVRQFAERIKTFVHFLEGEDFLAEGTLRRFKPPRITKVLREPFQAAEINAIWKHCQFSRTPARDEALFLLLLDTGMRIGEASGLTLDKLRIEQRQIIVGERGKSRRERLVPIGDGSKRDGGRVVRALRAYIEARPAGQYSGGRLFLSSDGRPLEATGASVAIQRLGDAAGVTNPIPHRLRHTFCTWYLVTFPGDELGLRRIVGHLGHDVLADYVHVAQSIIAERAGRASLAEAWLGNGARAAPMQERTAAGLPATNVRVRPPTESPRRTTGTSIVRNGHTSLSNVQGFRLHQDEDVTPFEF